MRQRLLFSALFGGLTVYLGYFAHRAQFGWFTGAYGLFFGLYALLVFGIKHTPEDIRWYTALGIALRTALLFSLPNLSDDFYRFLWDGRLLAQGINPFAHPPAYFIDNHIDVPGLTPGLFARLNSPHYFSVYPPVCQAAFGAAARLFPDNDWAAVVVMKLFLLAFEIGTIRLLAQKRANPSPALLYSLNPLLLLEIVGNVHFEGAMIFFLVAGLTLLERGRWRLGAVCWGLATAAKLLPPLFLPLVWRWLGWRRGFYFALIFGAATVFFFAPLLQPAVLAHIGASLRLYFRQFEFNASVYYLVKYAGSVFTEKEIGRMAGPLLGALTAGIVCWLAWRQVWRGAAAERLQAAMCLAASVYLFNATTVHPWYAAVPLALAAGTRWRFPVVWSGLAALSYSHYAGDGWREHYGLIALEYGVVWVVLAWELRQNRYSLPLSPTK